MLTEEWWADQLRTGQLSQPEEWLAVMTTMRKALEYPLKNALTLFKEECNYISLVHLKSAPRRYVFRFVTRDIRIQAYFVKVCV
jgi:hypothetical protein